MARSAVRSAYPRFACGGQLPAVFLYVSRLKIDLGLFDCGAGPRRRHLEPLATDGKLSQDFMDAPF